MLTLLTLPASEKGCRDAILTTLFPNQVTCPAGHAGQLLRPAYVWCPACRRKWRLKRRLGFAYAKLTYRQLLALVVCWQGRLSPGDIKHTTGLSYTTILRWLERLRARLPQQTDPLGGRLETDESFLGHRAWDNQAIVAGVMDAGGAVRLSAIADVAQDTIEGFLHRAAAPGSLLAADAHSSHLGLEAVGYGLELCNHSLGHFGPTNRIENVWSCLDRFVIRTRDRFLKQFLPGILREFQARRNYPELFTNPFAYLRATAVPL